MQRFIVFIFIIFLVSAGLGQKIQIRGGWYYWEDRKFFVKGIGCETHTRPGQVPWEYQFDPQLLRFDLNRIKQAGFNTIRTWNALSDEEMQIVEKSGLKVLFGIWIDPHGKYGDPVFIRSAKDFVRSVLNYSKKYNSIIGYLIMNEPTVEDVTNGGAAALVELWQTLIAIIHEAHPGIPVSVSNTVVGDYIRSDLFGIAAYNAYIYNPVTIHDSHGYAGFVDFLKNNRAQDMPLIITEFGLSVSPGSQSDDYGYGGNSLAQQAEGDLFMYRALIDGGAQGGCVFQYHDGWWKAGNPDVHDSGAEEWFGLIHFDDNSGPEGTPRPAWYAFERYNQAIITSPKNEEIYGPVIPIEMFLDDAVKRVQVVIDETVVLDAEISEPYLSTNLTIDLNEAIKDYVLKFVCLNAETDTLKTESITILCSKNTLTLPQLEMQITPENLNSGGLTAVSLQYTHVPVFSIKADKIDYVFHPHIGFAPGDAKSTSIKPVNNQWTFADNFFVPSTSKVATYGAGLTIQFGKFSKRIRTQKIQLAGDWAKDIVARDLSSNVEFLQQCTNRSFNCKLEANYPNPFNASTAFRFFLAEKSFVTVTIYNLLGQAVEILLQEYRPSGVNELTWNADDLASGIYVCELKAGNFRQMRKIVLQK